MSKPKKARKPRAKHMAEAHSYELLVRDIYQALVSQDAIANIVVRHNVKLIGRSGASHQIDVYWEFEIGGVRHRCCVECRHYNSSIKKTQVAAFSWILRDLDGAKGIMVTTKAYQTGAIEVAKQRRHSARACKLHHSLNHNQSDVGR